MEPHPLNIQRSTLASFAAAIVGIQVGSAIVATRFVIDQTQPGSLAFLRYTIGVVCLLPPLLASARVPFSKRDFLPITLLGITQFAIVVALLNYALQFIPSARAALIFATVPFQAMVLATLWGYEHFTLAKTIGVLLTIIGVGFVLGQNIFAVGTKQTLIGDIAVLVSAFAAASCSVLYRPYLQKYPTLQVSFWAMLASVLFLTFLAANEGFFNSIPNFTVGGWLAIGFIGVGSGVGYYLWLWALNNTSPTKVTIFLALNPITAAGFGAFFLGEIITATLTVGLSCVVLGLGLVHLGRN